MSYCRSPRPSWDAGASNMDGSIRLAKLTDHTLITLQGFLDAELAFNLMGVAQKAEMPVVLDLRQVSHVSPAGSMAILSFYQAHQQKPAIRNANPDIISLLELSGTARYVDFLPEKGEPTLTTQE